MARPGRAVLVGIQEKRASLGSWIFGKFPGRTRPEKLSPTQSIVDNTPSNANTQSSPLLCIHPFSHGYRIQELIRCIQWMKAEEREPVAEQYPALAQRPERVGLSPKHQESIRGGLKFTPYKTRTSIYLWVYSINPTLGPNKDIPRFHFLAFPVPTTICPPSIKRVSEFWRQILRHQFPLFANSLLR